MESKLSEKNAYIHFYSSYILNLKSVKLPWNLTTHIMHETKVSAVFC